MAEPIRNYAPRRDAREELRRRIENAPVDYAEALLAGYQLLQEAQDHGVLDTLRGAIGAGETLIGKVGEYANTPEGIRLMRNLLAAARLLGELDPAILDAAAQALSHTRHGDEDFRTPSLLQILQRLTGANTRRALAMVAEFSESFGNALSAGRSGTGVERGRRRAASGVAVPVIASAIVAMIAVFWIGRRSSSN